MYANDYNKKNLPYCMWQYVPKIRWIIGLGKGAKQSNTPTKNEINPCIQESNPLMVQNGRATVQPMYFAMIWNLVKMFNQ